MLQALRIRSLIVHPKGFKDFIVWQGLLQQCLRRFQNPKNISSKNVFTPSSTSKKEADDKEIKRFHFHEVKM